MSKSKIFLWFLVSFIGSVFVGSLLPVSADYFFSIATVVVIGTAISFFSWKNSWVFLCLMGIIFGLWRTDGALKKIFSREEREFHGEVLIVGQPQRKDSYQRVPVLNVAAGVEGLGEKWLAVTSSKELLRVGQSLEVSCKLENPENKDEKFNYVRFLAKDNIYQICANAKVKVLGKRIQEYKQLSIWEKSKLLFFSRTAMSKEIISQAVERLVPGAEGHYLQGLLLGDDDQIPPKVQEDFQRTGMTHAVAVSGYNITIIASFLVETFIFIGFWRKQAFWLAVSGIVFFVAMIGFPSSAVRAAIMGILVLWASKEGRLSDSLRLVLLAATIMVVISPLTLLYDVGFQLSFLSTLGIILLYRPLADRYQIQEDFGELKSIFLVSITAQLGVLGILLYQFEAVSLVSLLANLILLPLIPYIMLLGTVSIAFGFIFHQLAEVVSMSAWFLLHTELKAVGLLSEIPWAMVGVKNIGIFWLFGYYLFLIGLIVRLRATRIISKTEINANV